MALEDLAMQALRALAYYAGLVLIIRLAGKRMAGQTTTFDLLILITLGVVLQSAALEEGAANAVVFVATVFAAHRTLAYSCARCGWLRRVVRGGPRPLVKDGRILEDALTDEGLTRDELLAGLRKLGHVSVERVKLAVLEETGHISAVARES